MAANDYEARVRDTDGLADKRHDKAQEAAELQSRIDNLARLQLSHEDTAQRLAKVKSQIASIESDWQSRATTLGFPGMPLWLLTSGNQPCRKSLPPQMQSSSRKPTRRSYRSRLSRRRRDFVLRSVQPREHLPKDAEIDILVATANAFVEAASGAKARREELEPTDRQRQDLARGSCA